MAQYTRSERGGRRWGWGRRHVASQKNLSTCAYPLDGLQTREPPCEGQVRSRCSCVTSDHSSPALLFVRAQNVGNVANIYCTFMYAVFLFASIRTVISQCFRFFGEVNSSVLCIRIVLHKVARRSRMSDPTPLLT